MRELWAVFRMAARAAVWKATPGPWLIELPTLVIWTAIAIAAGLVEQYISAGGTGFTPYGLNASIAAMAVMLTVAAFFVGPEKRFAFLSGLLALAAFSSVAYSVIYSIPVGSLWEPSKPGLWTGFDTSILIFLFHLVWWIGAVLAMLRSIDPTRQSARLVRVSALWLALVASSYALPHSPTFRGKNYDPRSANLWEYIPALLEAKNNDEPRPNFVDGAQVEFAQPALLEDAIARLAPQTKGKTDIYAIGIAGFSQENVFVRELNGAFDSVLRTLPIEGRYLRLVNNPDTVAADPVATRQNFAAAVRAMARIMDKEEDVLLLFMTSHGYKSGAILWLPGVVSTVLSPADVASVLNREGIKNRVVIVSACHSGVFVGPLADENSIVLTASDADSVSFGCSNEREWTYFGDAFFNRSLKPGVDLERAFANARKLILEWEARDGLPSSNPTAHFGPVLTGKLSGLYNIEVASKADQPEAGAATAGIAPALP